MEQYIKNNLNIRPMYSQPWFGRRFILDESTLRWGRYKISDKRIAKSFVTDMLDMRAEFAEVVPGKIATTFEDLIHIYIPGALQSYLLEVDALATLEYSKLHLSALRGAGCSADAYVSARAAVVAAFETALAAVFQAALPLHKLHGLKFVQYRQTLHGMHLADFIENDVPYQVVFTPDLILECVNEVRTWKRVWNVEMEGR